MNKFKYISLGVLITLAVLFFFLNRGEVLISFLFVEVKTNVSSAIAVAFALGMAIGVLVMLVKKSSKKSTVNDASALPDEDIRGIDLRR